MTNTTTTEIYEYLHTLSLHVALPIVSVEAGDPVPFGIFDPAAIVVLGDLAVAVSLRPRSREAEVGDLGAALGGAGFRRGADIAGEDDEVLHVEVPFLGEIGRAHV